MGVGIDDSGVGWNRRDQLFAAPRIHPLTGEGGIVIE
jgi:hypothetical protein